MLKKLLFIIFLFFALQNSIFPQSLNMTLMSHFNDSNLKPCDNGQVWNDLTGYFDSIKKREYLIGGSCDSIYFFDVTNPSMMKKCDVREGHSRGSINRDYECYSHYVYCVSDRSTQSGSLQIFDLQYLPDSVHKVYDNDSLSINSHTIFIETKSQRIYLAGNNRTSGVSSSMLILSIANPEAPYKIGELSTGSACPYTHEVYVRNDTAYCSCAYSGLFFYDVTNAANPVLLGNIVPPYPGNGYNHSCWLDSTGKYIMFSDEVPFGLPIKIYDIHDMKSAKQVSVFNSNTGATPHNAYWKGRYAIVSSYEDGVYAYDLIDPLNPKVAGYYDTYPKNPAGTYNGYWRGCWGVYCFLPSGNILASDETEGFFVIQPTSNFGIQNQSEENSFHVSIYPNPVNEILNLKIYSAQKKSASLKVVDIIGNTILQKKMELMNGENIFSFDELKNHSPGMYFIQISSETISKNIKLLKH